MLLLLLLLLLFSADGYEIVMPFSEMLIELYLPPLHLFFLMYLVQEMN